MSGLSTTFWQAMRINWLVLVPISFGVMDQNRHCQLFKSNGGLLKVIQMPEIVSKSLLMVIALDRMCIWKTKENTLESSKWLLVIVLGAKTHETVGPLSICWCGTYEKWTPLKDWAHFTWISKSVVCTHLLIEGYRGTMFYLNKRKRRKLRKNKMSSDPLSFIRLVFL